MSLRRLIRRPAGEETIQTVKLFTNHCNYLKSHCKNIRTAVHSRSALDGSNVSLMANDLRNITGPIEEQLRTWESWSRLKSLIQHSYMKRQLENFINQLNSFMMIHNIPGVDGRELDGLRNAQRLDDLEMRQVLQEIVSDEAEVQALCEQPSSVEEVMKILQTQLMKSGLEPQERENLKARLWQLYQKTSILPPLLHMTQFTFTSPEPVIKGSCHDIYEGKWLDRQRVAVRSRRAVDSSPEAEDRSKKEVELWRKLEHPNIVPIYGMMVSEERVYSVLPWMENGNVLEYMLNVPNLDRLRLLCEVAHGLRYLHVQNVVHGNLHGNNVLVSTDGIARISDLSQSLFPEDRYYTRREYSIRWPAPEVYTHRRPTSQSDIWSFGMLCLEIWANVLLLHGNDKEVTRRLSGGEYPDRPESILPELWVVIVQCWAKVPERRLTISEVSSCLKEIREGVSSPTISLQRSNSGHSAGGVSRISSHLKSGPFLGYLNESDTSLTSPGTAISTPSDPGRSHTGQSPNVENQKITGFRSWFSPKRLKPSKNENPAILKSSSLEPLEEPDVGSCIDWGSVVGDYHGNNSDELYAAESGPPPSESSSDSGHPLQNSIQTLKNWDEPGVGDHGSLNDMVEILIDGKFKSPGHVDCRDIFLSACVELTTPGRLFQILSQKFSEQDLERNNLQRKVVTQINVLSAIHEWLQRGYFLPGQEVLRQMKTFCEDHARVHQIGPLLKKLEGLQREIIRCSSTPANSVERPWPNAPSNIDFSPRNLAIGLTLLEGNNFRCLKRPDFITYLTTKVSDNINVFSETAQKIKGWVVAVVFHHDDIFKRANMMGMFIDAATECQRRRNFSSAVAIAFALHAPPVKNLTETKTALTPRHRDKLLSLSNLVHGTRRYHEALRTTGNARERGLGIPWLPYHFQRLDDVLQRNPVMIDEDVINFRRYIKFMDRLQEEIFCYVPPTLNDQGSRQIEAWVRQQLWDVPLFNGNDPEMSTRIAKVMDLEEEDRIKRTVGRNRAGLRTA